MSRSAARTAAAPIERGHALGTRTLYVRNYDCASHAFVVSSYDVTVSIEAPTGVCFLWVAGIRFGLVYSAKDGKELVCGLDNPAMLPYSSKAYEIARKMHTSSDRQLEAMA